MEKLARPRIPEKPPVAAKPRLRPTPPRPPKPPAPASTSAPSSSAQNDHIHSHSLESHTSQNGLFNNSASKPRLSISQKANSAETLSPSSETMSPRSPDRPPLPAAPPSFHPKKSSSLSLPASFRKKNVNKIDLHSPLAFKVVNPLTPSSSNSSTTCKSPIGHVYPPRKVPPVPNPKPKHLTESSPNLSLASGAIQNIGEFRGSDDEERLDKQTSHLTSENSLTATELAHLETQRSSKPVSQVAPTHKHSAAPPLRPLSPPSRSAPYPGRPSNPPSRPSLSGTTSAAIHQEGIAAEKNTASATDRKSSSERKPAIPPPLPKNPPCGGVPRKPRQLSFKSSQLSETNTPRKDSQILEPAESSHNATTANPHAEGSVSLNNVSQSETVQSGCHDQLQQDKQQWANVNHSDIVTTPLDTAGSCQISSEAAFQAIEVSKENHDCVPKPKTPPKPRPRTRPSLCFSAVSEIISQSPVSSDNTRHQDSINEKSIAGSTGVESPTKKTELEYAEVFQESLDEHSDVDVRVRHEHIGLPEPGKTYSLVQNSEKSNENRPASDNVSSLKQSNTGTCQNVTDTEETDAENETTLELIVQNIDQPAKNCEQVNSVLNEACISRSNSDESVSDNHLTRQVSIHQSSSSLFQDEPEATCDMLKEIEELLKNKLGDIELDLSKSSESLNQNIEHPENTESHTDLKAGLNCEESLVSNFETSSPSPMRPPRPKRQATIFKHLGSLESLNASINSTSTECLADPGLSESPVSCTGKKTIPPKPKRTFTRVSRSHSDVTAMKSIVDSSTSETDLQPLDDDVKPYLPPRLESLKRNDSSNSLHSPPPLPPRNKPRSSSLIEVCGIDSEPPALPLRSSSIDKESKNKTQLGVLENVDPSATTPSAQLTPKAASKNASKVALSKRPRPNRKAPPPPASPRRSATFSSGDITQTHADESSEDASMVDTTQASALPTVKRSSSALCKQPNTEMEDNDYHEISDTMRIKKVSSQEREETPPPALPPRIVKGDLDGSHESLLSDTADNSSVTLSHVGAKYSSSESQSPQTDKTVEEKKSANPKEQKYIEKMAKSALIQKVAQGLGLGKSFKKSKIIEVADVPDVANKESVDDLESVSDVANKESVDDLKSVKSNSVKVEELVAEIKSNNPVSSAVMQDTEENIPATEASCSSMLSDDRPSSEVSQRSSGSEQEGNSPEFEPQNIEEIVSSGTDTEPEEDKEEIYAIRKAKKVFFIAKEIASSEDTFVDVLKLLNLDFRLHISKLTETLGHPVAPTETLNKILDFLPQLQNFNEDLLKDLKERIENWETNPRLADIFVKKGPFLKLYSSYIRNFENATATLEDVTKKNPAFASALREFEMSPRCAKLALKHYMLKPIQRIPQYKLLLQDYLKQLTEVSLDYKDTVTALNIVSEVADHANDSMRHGDNVQKLLEVQKSLIGQFEVIQPGRVLVKQGELLKLSRKEMQPRMFFLFNDVLLYTTPATTGYRINNILPLTGMKINSPKLEDYKFEFNIISVQRSFTLTASTSEEKEQWVTALQAAIEDNTKKHHTFQAVKQAPQTSLLDKDFVLGHKAPLWVPDARVTMCMLCLLEFTLTWRRHHCRSCGRVVCSNCSYNKAPLRYLKYLPARVCDNCYENLKADLTSKFQQNQSTRKIRALSISEEDSTTSVSETTTEDSAEVADEEDSASEPVKHDSGLSLHHLMSRFQKIRTSNREKRRPSNFRPSVLKEVHANDEGSDMSGYLRVYRSRKWKRLWFVVKGKILYTYKASEDMAASESMPLLGYEVTRINTYFEGAEPDLLFELTHQNNQPLTTRKDGDNRVLMGSEKTTQRLIFRTDSSAATTKWVTVLRESSLTY
ncbi:hypothetical protein BsWGS_11493 [Bradybaena similaris]